MNSSEDRAIERQLRIAANRAFKRTMDSLKHEPHTIILCGQTENDPDCPDDEIAAWLFQKRDEDGNARN